MAKKPSPGYVYVASIVGNPNICKIGYTRKNPEERVSMLYKDYPCFNFELYRSFWFERPARHEFMCHQILHAARLDREVFSVTPIEGCFAVERTVGKHFSQITESEEDFDLSDNSPWEISGSNQSKAFYNYIRYRLGLEFVPELSFDEFKNLINTYLEIHDVRSQFDIKESLLVNLVKEADL